MKVPEHSVPEPIAPVNAVLGEGPVWVERDQALWWVDIKGPAVFRWSEADGVERWTPPLRICSLAPAADGGFVAGTERGIFRADPAAGLYEAIADPEALLHDNRFNDGKLDRAGRFWAGTMDDREEQAQGSLYRLDPDLSWHVIDDGYMVTNGPAFSPDGRTMYHTDSAKRLIYAFDLDGDGNAGDRRVFASFREEHGHPDGMTVDAEGCLWVAFWNGWCLRRLSPDGDVLHMIDMPVERPTSCAFGGASLDRLFVTSARVGLNENALAVQPLAGALFMFDAGVRGIADRPFG
ncbi:SMP-30/gluconolactonase/LRE family protein [Sphingomonas sp.]|uniref:SMP-30/gluconolactonase/LRE family protein n=1 Tax=Sphingomonas sp. TaxID=28214 RepID=UPI002DBCA928|nr:SMP-30/gluconolactonase/LRE family protein [Sphingomonas sp.]HEU4967937.1 SMP-30/gluconolactonase/LRE family protein [Sphingomonas sp.]